MPIKDITKGIFGQPFFTASSFPPLDELCLSSMPWAPFLNSTMLRPSDRMTPGSRLPNKSRTMAPTIAISGKPGMPINANKLDIASRPKKTSGMVNQQLLSIVAKRRRVSNGRLCSWDALDRRKLFYRRHLGGLARKYSPNRWVDGRRIECHWCQRRKRRLARMALPLGIKGATFRRRLSFRLGRGVSVLSSVRSTWAFVCSCEVRCGRRDAQLAHCKTWLGPIEPAAWSRRSPHKVIAGV